MTSESKMFALTFISIFTFLVILYNSVQSLDNKIEIENFEGDCIYDPSLDFDKRLHCEQKIITEEGSMIVYPVERDPFPKPLTEKQQEVFDEVNSGFIDFRKTLMKMEVDNIINLTKAYPDLLTDDEVNILLSVAIGKGHGMEDPEVDVKAIKIMYKIIEYLMDEQK